LTSEELIAILNGDADDGAEYIQFDRVMNKRSRRPDITTPVAVGELVVVAKVA